MRPHPGEDPHTRMALHRVPLSDPAFDRICMLISESYPNSCVLRIDRIENEVLAHAYRAAREELEGRFGVGTINNVQVFHGTRSATIGTIVVSGFDPGKNVRSVYGRGVYFSKSAAMSKDYSDVPEDGVSYLIISDLLVGPTVQGRGKIVIDTTSHTAAVDNTENPRIYVCPKKEYVLPRYVVAFHKNAA